MSPKTLKALKLSIAHWKRLATGTEKKGEMPHADDCALCKLFWTDNGCKDCPVAAKTGLNYCIGTPYLAAIKAWRARFRGIEGAIFLAAAQKELEFLESLLPAEEANHG